ncbi:pyridoxamine 5'-phosphate oxidase family protein [Rhodobacterales bacterium HKCCE3408]|nr:pyridoxamine 5'-phosphate oxidase family protein [Rhodobacterales bacterium HKCCE3408]
MPTPAELETHFWTALRKDMTVLLACDGAPPRPMTAQVSTDRDAGPLWFFTATDTDIGEAVASGPKPAVLTFASQGHDVFASASGTLTKDMDRAKIDELWNPFVAAWYEQGKDDPKLCLVRMDATDAHIWETGNSLVAGLKILLGSDPKQDFEDQTAQVRLDH